MKKISIFLSILTLILGSLVFSSAAYAQATRTWVSGVGDDVNPCSRTAPCKTFAGAISKTATGGQISVLDPGGFGAVTVTKSITIDGGGIGGSILNASSNGVIVNGAGAIVVLRNLDIDGSGVGGTNGIRFIQGASLQVEKVAIRNNIQGTASGISFEPTGTASLFLDEVTVSNSGTALTGGGIVIKPVGVGTRKILISNTSSVNNPVGITIDGNGNSGNLFATIADTTVSSNSRGIHVLTPAAGGSNVQVTLDNVTLANNQADGILVNGATAEVFIGDSTVTANGTGVKFPVGVLQSFKNNQIFGNNVEGTPVPAVPGGPLN
jgi:hypothetical protein